MVQEEVSQNELVLIFHILPINVFVYSQGEPITFCEESFVNHRSCTMRNFLSMAVNLQLFKQVQTAICTCMCV